MSDPIDLIRELAPTAGHQPELVERVRSDLMATINEPALRHGAASGPVLIGPARTRQRWLIPAAAALMLTLAAAAWAITQTSTDTTVLECPSNSIIDAVTGDPITDCTNEWRRSRGTEPPAMVAYDNGDGGISVRLASDEAPERYTALKPGPFQNTGLIQLGASLGDAGSGLVTACYDEDTARRITRRELDRLNFRGWTITVDDERRPDGDTRCAYFIIDPTTQQVELIGFDSTLPGANPYESYATALADRLTATCMSLDAAASLARSLAAGSAIVINGNIIDFSEEAEVLVIHTVEDPTADCTRSVVNVGGRVEATLRGPTG